MATYGLDFYGASFYGGTRPTSDSDEAFSVDARSYSAALLTWQAPEISTWDYIRVMRSRAGHPTNVFEGDEVFYALSGAAGARNPETTPVDPTWPLRQNVISFSDRVSYLDTGLSGGWYYYSVFLHNTARNAWERVSLASTLIPFDYESIDRIWSLVPEFYRTVQDNTAGYSTVLGQINPSIYLTRDRIADNLTLSKWISVFGWGMDILRSQADSVLDGYDPSRAHMNRMGLLAEQFGTSIETSVSPHYNRSLVRNLSLLYRQRGTMVGLEDHLRLATGWDIDVTLGPNMMLSKDQAEVASPVVDEWNAEITYTLGDVVQRAGVYYQALSTHRGQQPPNVTYWSVTPFAESLQSRSTQYLSKYNDVSTWRRYVGGVTDPGKTWIGMGVPDPANVALETNALETHNDNTTNLVASTKFTLMSVPLTAVDTQSSTSSDGKQAVLETAIPIVVPPTWDSSKVYESGDTVLYLGVPYEANTRTSSVPDGSSQWKQMGYDSRPLLGFSAFVHGPFNGAVGGGMTAKPVVSFFDLYGTEMVSRYALDTTSFAGVIYDSFLGPKPLDLVANNGRTTPIGSVSWTVNTGPIWKTGRDSNGGFASPGGAALSYATFSGAQANAWLGLTFRTIPAAPREIGVIVRRSDANNYWAVTNLGIYKVVAGVKSTVQTWAAGSYQVGDRMQIRFHSAGIQVLRIRAGVTTSLYSGSDTFNAATTNTHGVIAW